MQQGNSDEDFDSIANIGSVRDSNGRPKTLGVPPRYPRPCLCSLQRPAFLTDSRQRSTFRLTTSGTLVVRVTTATQAVLLVSPLLHWSVGVPTRRRPALGGANPTCLLFLALL